MKSLLPPELQHTWDVRDTVPRSERFKELAFAGYPIPQVGPFSRMKRIDKQLVVYLDEYAHCGEGKVLWHPGDPEPPADTFCSQFVGKPGWSERYLVVGYYGIRLRYESDNWQSNVGGSYQITSGVNDFRFKSDLFPYPMYAVDMVSDEPGGYTTDERYVDLNTCPGVPVEVVNLVGREALRDSVREFCRAEGLIG